MRATTSSGTPSLGLHGLLGQVEPGPGARQGERVERHIRASQTVRYSQGERGVEIEIRSSPAVSTKDRIVERRA